MIIDMKDKKNFTLHVNLEEMRKLDRALSSYSNYWDDDKCWELSGQIRKMLDSNRITFEEMVAEEERLKSLGLM